MPELPEVETVRRGLAQVLEGRRLSRVITRRRTLRWPLPENFGQRLTNRQVLSVERRAKFIVIRLDSELVWISHLGMSGRFSTYRKSLPPEENHDHIIIETDEGVTLRYNDPRRFGFMDLTTTVSLPSYPLLKSIGPEPLDKDFNPTVLGNRLRDRTAPIKSALLNQRIIAGLGNIYVCEALYGARISPKRKARSIQGRLAKDLHRAIVDVLSLAIQAGGSSLRDHRQPDGEFGYFQQKFSVYGRTGENCQRCGPDHQIRKISQSGRTTFYCPNCQR